MLNSINSQLISLADAVSAEIRYEVSMNVNFSTFYLLSLKKQSLEQEVLNYNLYKNHY